MIRVLCLLFLCAVPAEAQHADVVAAYVRGDFRGAAIRAEVYRTPDDLAWGARAVLAEALMENGVDPTEEALLRAENLARAALEADPDHVEARLQLAISLSLLTRPMPLRKVIRSGYGEAARSLAEGILESDPENHYAHGFLAVWHVEVIARGGRLGAMFMGASLSDARTHYRAASLSDPDDGALHWQWARVLAARNVRRHRDEIETALQDSIMARPDDAIEGIMQARAQLLLDALQTGSGEDAETLARSLL